MRKSIEQLYRDSDGFQELRDHLSAFVNLRTLELAFERKSTDGMADAKDVIEAAFDDLDTKFGGVEKPQQKQPQSPR